jgi:hypothetical protein
MGFESSFSLARTVQDRGADGRNGEADASWAAVNGRRGWRDVRVKVAQAHPERVPDQGREIRGYAADGMTS